VNTASSPVQAINSRVGPVALAEAFQAPTGEMGAVFWASYRQGRDHPRTAAELAAEADAQAVADLAATRATQATNRRARYIDRLPAKFADAAVDQLTADQHRDRVARWLDSPIRALLLAGPSRTGKTTAAYAIANVASSLGMWVEATTAADLVVASKPSADDPTGWQLAVGCELLILDDLGAERATDWWLEQLGRLADARTVHNRRTIVTTNASHRQLTAIYGDRIVERLIDGAGTLKFEGRPWRTTITDW